MPTYDSPMPHHNHMPTNIHMSPTTSQNNLSNSNPNLQQAIPFKTTKLKIGSINCRSLASTSDPITRRKFTRYLRSLKYDLLNFQEVRTEDNNVIESLNMELQAKDSIWTQHVGICITSTTTLSRYTYLLNDYAPSQPGPKKQFYSDTIGLPLFKDETDEIFNYHHYTTYRSSNSHCPHPIRSWKQTLNQHLYDCINSDDITETYSVANLHITFSRGNSRTTIDYIFASLSIKASMTKSGVDFINTDWTDHALISIDLVLVSKKHGKGIYRANPALAKNKRFVEQLSTLLQELKPDTTNSPHNSPQNKWNSMKRKQIERLQTCRSKIIAKHSDHPAILNQLLPTVEQQLGILQKEVAEIDAIRAGRHWQEQGEISAGYLKRTITQREQQRTMNAVSHPVSGELCHNDKDTQEATHVTHHRDEYKITRETASGILEPFTIDDILEGAKRSPAKTAEHQQASQKIDRFFAKDGLASTLQQRLHALDDQETTLGLNWLDRLWLKKGYLEYRIPTLLNVNWWNQFRDPVSGLVKGAPEGQVSIHACSGIYKKERK
ncbi:uncharacterized protein EV154DRAFT_565327 [Mucor mucedo]|uniref:uncharacterized protein n=1 Tax=Mucor mucedo TaxID=29922 RepID=UPI00221FC8C8|nr:uncharacterized protein EV154DRAFT_565327 [Mucor mucedo]KAI7889501.1 hypothetical protein EV154DRAFT_565327 [Mucor mucedo]